MRGVAISTFLFMLSSFLFQILNPVIGNLYFFFHYSLFLFNPVFEAGFAMLLTAGASLWAWWENNSFTQNAIIADEYLHHK